MFEKNIFIGAQKIKKKETKLKLATQHILPKLLEI